jgi:salicylate hydroxylase
VEEKRIAIVGGGLAGFACGIALVNSGFRNVYVFERDLNFNERRQGYGLTILQGITALRKLGDDVYQRVKDLDTPSRSHYIFDWKGKILGFYGTVFYPDSAASSTSPTSSLSGKSRKKHNLHISRQNLRRILQNKFEECAPGHLIWKKRLQRLVDDEKNKNVVLEFTDETTHVADLVIGCDGINSRVRKAMFGEEGDMPLKYLGIIVVLGITYSEHPLAKERVFQTVDGNTRLFAMPYADSEDTSLNTMWQLSFPLPEEKAKRLAADSQLLKQEVYEMCKEWHEPIPSMIESTDLPLLMGIVAYDRDPVLPRKITESKRMVLLGDAAHPMSPFKGQGANQALLDATNFVGLLTNPNSESMESAIELFEREMIQRVRSKVMLSRERAFTFHDPSIVQTESFAERGVSEGLVKLLEQCGINSQSGEDIEKLILQEMERLQRTGV